METAQWNPHDGIRTMGIGIRMINLHDGIRMIESAWWNCTMEFARWNSHDGTRTMECTEGHNATFTQEGIRTPDSWSWTHTRCYSILGKNRPPFSLQLLWEVRTGYLPRSALRPRYRPLFLPKAILQKSNKHCTKTPVSSTTYSLVYKVLSAHPSLIENCAGRVKSYDPIHDNGV